MLSTHDTVIDKSTLDTVIDKSQATVIDKPFQPTVIDRAVLSGMGKPYQPPRPKRFTQTQLRVIGVSAAFLFVVTVYAIAVLGNDTAVGAVIDKSAILVKTVRAVPRLTAEPVHSTGVLTARRELPLAFKMAGLVRSVDVNEGDFVQAGQLLAELDSSEVGAQLRQTREAVAKANRDYARVKSLIQANALPLQVMQDARTQQAVALAALKVAEFNERYTRIIAPCDGVITKRHKEPNELIAAGVPVLEFAATESGWVVRTGVADRDVLRLKVGDTARVKLGGYAEQTFGGRVTGIAAKASATTGTFDVEVEVNPGGVPFLSGLVAKVDLEPTAQNQLVAIPIESLLEGDGRVGQVFVLGIDGTHVNKVPVSIAFIDDPVVVLSSGLTAGRFVITDGAAYLKEGSAVRLPQAAVADR